MKRLLALILVLILILGVIPVTAMAEGGGEYPYEDVSGTVYISVSNDARYVTSDGTDKGTIMAYVPVDLAELRKVHLEEHGATGYEQYYFDADGNGKYDVTVFQLFLYVLDQYYSGTSAELSLEGAPQHMYMKNGFWGHGENLLYYVNGSYPLDASLGPNMGATADAIPLKDGDFIDVTMYKDWSFYSDDAAGFHYFTDASGGITHEYRVAPEKALTVNYIRVFGDVNQGSVGEPTPSVGSTISYGKELYGQAEGTVTTDKSGKASITFPKAGVYYLWADGEYGTDNENSIVSSPAYCKVTVSTDVCDHSETKTAYTPADSGKHTVTVSCKKCGKVLSTSEETCTGDEAHTAYASDFKGSHTKTVTCAKCGETISSGTEACVKGEDGKCALCGYTFPNVSEDGYTITVNVAPASVNVTFYSDENAENALPAEKVVDKGTVGDYHVYEITVPEGTYSYRAVDTADNHELGGMTFEAPISVEIGADGTPIHNEQKMTLARVNYYTTNPKVKNVGDYSINIMPGKLKSVVTGAQYSYYDEEEWETYIITPTLLHAHGNALVYNWKITLNGDLAENYGVDLAINETFGESTKATVTKKFLLKSLTAYTVTAPKDATVKFFNQVKNFNVEEVPVSSTKENADGTVTHTIKAPSGNLTYRVSREDYITKAGYLSQRKGYKDVVVTFGEDEDPMNRESAVPSDVLAKRMESSTMVNVNGQNELMLGVGETFRLRAYRGAWQIINSDTANIMIEPDFNYKVVTGGQHIKMTPAANRCTGNAGEGKRSNWMDIEGVSEGLTILEVSYDAIEIGGDTKFTGLYGATDSNRTSLIMIRVGEETGKLVMKAVGSDNIWDTEYDTVYSLKNVAPFTFTATLDGAEPTVEYNVNKGQGRWLTAKKNEDGSFTIPNLQQGSKNVIRFTANGKTAYQVVRAAKVTYSIENQTRGGETAYVGDDICLTFHGLYQPISKFSGIYNPGFGRGHKVSFTLPDGAELKKASGGQYDFITTNKYVFTVKSAGDVTLTGGNVQFNVMGTDSPLGGHRTLTDSGVGVNFSAVSTDHTRDILPDITITVKTLVSASVSFDCTPADAEVTVYDATGAIVPKNKEGTHSLQVGNYTYEVSAAGYLTARGSFAISEDTTEKTVAVTLEKGDATTWDGKTLTPVTPNADGVYEIRTGAELAWIASQVNNREAVSKVKLMNDISLGNNQWTPIGDNYQEFCGEFDGNGHVVRNLYIKNGKNRQGLFGTVRSASITRLGVEGTVITTGDYAAGIATFAYEDVVISQCYSAVHVTASDRAAGICSNPQLESLTITDCYNVGTVTAAMGMASGIACSAVTQNRGAMMTNCYNAGKVTGGSKCGAISDTMKEGAIQNCYYLAGCVDSKSGAGSGMEKTEAELKNVAMAELLGANFHADGGHVNSGYPVLTWQYWGETVYTWSEDNGSVTATRTARHDPAETETETVTTSCEVRKAATCVEKGEGKYTALFTRFAAAEKVAEIPVRGHHFGDWTVTKTATCAEEGEQTRTCADCEQTETRPVAKLTTHTWDAGKVTKEATVYEEGVRTYTCTVCKATRTEPIPRLAITAPGKPAQNSYNTGASENDGKLPFGDVLASDWYYGIVRKAWETGLIDGVSASEFRPDSQLTVAQAIKLAASLHQMQKTGSVTLTSGSPNWYDSYVAYAVSSGILEKDYLDYSRAQMNAPATRGEFVHIFSGALSDAAAINTVSDNRVPDVKTTDKYGAEIYRFYRAGITVGSDAQGTFHPASSIKRSEAAAILLRMMDAAERKHISMN